MIKTGKNWLNNVELLGKKVKLLPLSESHKDGILAAASDGELWNLWYTSVPNKSNIDNYIAFALNEQKEQRSLPFVVVDLATGKIIGSTRYCNAEPDHRRLEIGYTWYAKSCQRTGVNTECKHLLLSHAFETLGAIAVEFRTNWYNFKSRSAIARLGAKQEGVLRNHRIGADGVLRDTVVFSIIQNEWKSVKYSLEFEINKYADG